MKLKKPSIYKNKSDFFVFSIEDRIKKSKIFYFVLVFLFLLMKSIPFASAGKLKRVSYLLLRFFPLSALRYRAARYLISIGGEKIEAKSNFCFHYSIIIKKYVSKKEKGILLVSFEKQLDKLNAHPRAKEILERYFVIFVPSTSGYISESLLRFKALNNHCFATMPVHLREAELSLAVFGNSIRPLNYSAASWVDSSRFTSKPHGQRTIDCLLVANFGAAKRHRVMFGVLSKLAPEIRLTCVGLPVGGREKSDLIKEARSFGVADRINIVENPDQQLLREIYASAKVFCAVSYIEGSYIGVAEALISGTPVIMFKDAIVGTKSLIDSKSGYLAKDLQDYRSAIETLMKESDHTSIRESAISLVDARRNCEKLNEDLKTVFLDLGFDWTDDISFFYSQKLTSRYLDVQAEEKMYKDYQYFKSLGIEFSL